MVPIFLCKVTGDPAAQSEEGAGCGDENQTWLFSAMGKKAAQGYTEYLVGSA